MKNFKEEHLKTRKKYHTTEQADYWLKMLNTTYMNDEIIAFLQSVNYFFFATSSVDGMTNVNFKGTQGKTIIKVISPTKLIFPDFDGNGILHSIGDIASNPNIGMLVIDFANDVRVKINGKAKVIDDKKIIEAHFDVFETYNIARLIEIDIEYVIPNCSTNLSLVRKSLLK